MKNLYKSFFWILLPLFILTNLFWFYQAIDTAVGISYSRDACEEYQKDSENLKKRTIQIQNKNEALNFINKYKLKTDTLQKGKNFHINFGSYHLSFDQNGNKIKE